MLIIVQKTLRTLLSLQSQKEMIKQISQKQSSVTARVPSRFAWITPRRGTHKVRTGRKWECALWYRPVSLQPSLSISLFSYLVSILFNPRQTHINQGHRSWGTKSGNTFINVHWKLRILRDWRLEFFSRCIISVDTQHEKPEYNKVA